VDLVESAVSFTLGANVENLTLTGTDKINGTGNALNNVLTGNAGNNVLDGKGGTDTMIGGAGDDIYVLDKGAELGLITENPGEGNDTLRILYAVSTPTNIDLTVAGLQNIENVTIVGAGAFSVTGNALNNILIGNAAANTLNGGAGDDTLNGGAGADTMSGGTGMAIRGGCQARKSRSVDAFWQWWTCTMRSLPRGPTADRCRTSRRSASFAGSAARTSILTSSMRSSPANATSKHCRRR
jgi:hypothetical protein